MALSTTKNVAPLIRNSLPSLATSSTKPLTSYSSSLTSVSPPTELDRSMRVARNPSEINRPLTSTTTCSLPPDRSRISISPSALLSPISLSKIVFPSTTTSCCTTEKDPREGSAVADLTLVAGPLRSSSYLILCAVSSPSESLAVILTFIPTCRLLSSPVLLSPLTSTVVSDPTSTLSAPINTLPNPVMTPILFVTEAGSTGAGSTGAGSTGAGSGSTATGSGAVEDPPPPPPPQAVKLANTNIKVPIKSDLISITSITIVNVRCRLL